MSAPPPTIPPAIAAAVAGAGGSGRVSKRPARSVSAPSDNHTDGGNGRGEGRVERGHAVVRSKSGEPAAHTPQSQKPTPQRCVGETKRGSAHQKPPESHASSMDGYGPGDVELWARGLTDEELRAELTAHHITVGPINKVELFCSTT